MKKKYELVPLVLAVVVFALAAFLALKVGVPTYLDMRQKAKMTKEIADRLSKGDFNPVSPSRAKEEEETRAEQEKESKKRLDDRAMEWITACEEYDAERVAFLAGLNSSISEDDIKEILEISGPRKFPAMTEYHELANLAGEDYVVDGDNKPISWYFKKYLEPELVEHFTIGNDPWASTQNLLMWQEFGPSVVVAANRSWDGEIRPGDMLLLENEQCERHLISVINPYCG